MTPCSATIQADDDDEPADPSESPDDDSPSLEDNSMTGSAAHALAAIGLDQLLNW